MILRFELGETALSILLLHKGTHVQLPLQLQGKGVEAGGIGYYVS